MDDAAFKKLFSDPRMIGLLIRRHVPEWADRVDYRTLQPLPTGNGNWLWWRWFCTTERGSGTLRPA